MKNKRVSVLGVGVSNAPLIDLLLQNGASVTVCDRKTKEALGDLADSLAQRGTELKLGEDYLENLEGDVIFRTPGINRFREELLEAERRGVMITSEMEAFMQVCPCPIIGVTGSDGKTTTSTLIARILERAGKKVWLGGNIGRPLLAETGGIGADDIAVLELSSFQLMGMTRSPDIGAITNISPNHLDIHKDMEEYVTAKINLCAHVPNRLSVLNAADPYAARAAASANGDVAYFGWQRPETAGKTLIYCQNERIVAEQDGKMTDVLALSDIKIIGRHNVENYMCAIAAVWGMARVEDIQDVAKTFGGVEHRIELVRELDGVRYFNDSIASSPNRTMAGLRAFNQKLILIAGGADKKIPFDELGPELIKHVKVLLLTGPTRTAIRRAAENAAGYDPATLQIIDCDDIPDAVRKARTLARPGDIVTLSPACTSFDAYKNFEQRGNHFKELVAAL